MKLSQKFADFNTEVIAAVPYIATNATHLRVTAAQSTAQTDFQTDWNTKYTRYITPSTHTPQSVTDINELYDNFHPAYAALKKQIKNDQGVTLTGADIAALHIHVDQPHRAHVPRPTGAPANQVLSASHLVTKIFTSNPTPPHATELALPDDVKKVGRKLAVTAAGAPAPTPEQYHPLEAIGSTVYDIVFAPEQEGAKAYLITFYTNPRGEEGPPSTPVSFTII